MANPWHANLRPSHFRDLCSDKGEISISVSSVVACHARGISISRCCGAESLWLVCPYIDQLPQALIEVRPTIFVGVPRVYEKISRASRCSKQKAFPRNGSIAGRLAVGRDSSSRDPRRSNTYIVSVESMPMRLVYSAVRAGIGRAGGKFSSPAARL